MRAVAIALAGSLGVPALAMAAGGGDGANVEKELELLFYASINFVLFVGLIVYFLRRPTKEYLRSRYLEITRELDRISHRRDELQTELDEARARLDRVDEEGQKLVDDMVAAGEREREHELKQAERLAQAIADGAEQRIAGLEREARDELIEQATAHLQGQAAEHIRQRLDADGNASLSRGLMAQLEQSS